jgi:hypothetical protein
MYLIVEWRRIVFRTARCNRRHPFWPRSWCDRLCEQCARFQRRESCHRRIVPNVARAAHAADDAVVSRQLLELLAGILAPLIRVMQQLVRFAASPHRHQQCICDRLSRHARTHRPANHTSREQTNYSPYVKPALAVQIYVKSAVHFWFSRPAARLLLIAG